MLFVEEQIAWENASVIYPEIFPSNQVCAAMAIKSHALRIMPLIALLEELQL